MDAPNSEARRAGAHGPGLPRVHCFDDELARLDAVATADALDRGVLSVREVIAAAVDRARRIDPAIGAVAFERYEAALGSLPVRSAGHGGFVGIPTFIKDMVPVAGLPMTWGSAALAGGPPLKRSGGVATDVERIGMPILGTSTMPEWGFTPSTEFPHRPPTRNPWNPERTVGGSSGGAAALVAAGVVPIAHAADGGGSIRIPAACAGLVGLKPTLGRLRRHPDEARLPLAVTVDGIVTRTVRDTAQWYAAVERGRPARGMPPIGEVTGPPSRRLRVGRISRLPGVVDPDEATRATLDETTRLLEDLGHHVDDIPPPVDIVAFRDDFVAYFQFLVFMATRTARLTHGSHVRIDEIADFTRGMASDFRRRPHRLPGAARRLRRVRSQVAQVHERYDVVLSPVVSSVPPRLGHLSTAVDYDPLLGRIVPWVAFAPIANAAGTPAISVPIGFDSASGLPLASMLSAGHGEDALLLQLALEIEQARPWALSRLR